MLLNPMSEEFASNSNQQERTRYLTAGRKVLAPVGFARGKSSKKGTPYIEIGFVCVSDLEDSGEVGAVTTRKFWITERSIAMLGKFFRALGVTNAFDTDSDEDIEKALATGYVQSTLKTETYTKSDGSEGASTSPVFFDPINAPENPSWEDEVRAKLDWFDGYLQRQQERAAQYSNNAAPAATPSNAGPFTSDDVPF